MFFRHYTDAVSNMTKGLAKGIFTVGLLLMGFGALILLFPEFFAMLVGIIFIAAGIGFSITAIKIIWKNRTLRHYQSDDYRKNVQIHFEEHCD